MSELPPGWSRAALADLGSHAPHALAIGPFGSSLKVSDYRDSGVPLIFVRNVRSGDFDLVPTFVSEEKAQELSAHLVLPGDVLVTKMGDPPGDTSVYPATRQPAVLTADCIKVTPHPAISAHYLSHAIRSPGCADQIAEMTSGVAQQKVSLAKIRQLRLPVAPAAEQERIVAAIEEALSLLDAGEAGLHATRLRLKRMRDSILTAAVTGQLVPQESDGGLPVVPRVPSAAENTPVLPHPWTWTELSELATSLRNGVFASRPREQPPGVPILRIGSVRPLRLDLADIRFADLDVNEPRVRAALLEPGDLLFTRYNGNPDFVGACAEVPALTQPLLHPDKLIRVKVDPSTAVPGYIAVAASSGLSRRFIESVTKTTAGQAGVAGSDLKQMPVPLPPVREQVRIVAEVERQFSFIEAAERAVDAGLARSKTLRRSVLKAAFEGRLVPQDPTDEPASELLARIAADRTAAPPRVRRASRPALKAGRGIAE